MRLPAVVHIAAGRFASREITVRAANKLVQPVPHECLGYHCQTKPDEKTASAKPRFSPRPSRESYFGSEFSTMTDTQRSETETVRTPGSTYDPGLDIPANRRWVQTFRARTRKISTVVRVAGARLKRRPAASGIRPSQTPGDLTRITTKRATRCSTLSLIHI